MKRSWTWSVVSLAGFLGIVNSFLPELLFAAPERPHSSTAFTNDFTIDTTTTNLTDQMLGLCANNCFAGTTSYSTVPYYTFDTPRNVTLVYTEERAHPRPVIYADVTPTTGTPTQYTLQATLNGTRITFMNGDTLLYFAGSGSGVRLGGQFDASSHTTGIYTLAVTVTASYAGGGNVSHSYSRSLVIVNEATSPIARGWTIAGVQRIYFSGSSYLITDGTGNAVIFTGLGVPAADYSILTYNAGSNTYAREYVDGTRVVFNGAGFMATVRNRLGIGTNYYYDTSNRLSNILDPARANMGVATAPYIDLAYNTTYGLRVIQERVGATRVTTVTIGADSSLQRITDPDLVSTAYTYDDSGRVNHIINRRGDTTTYAYNNYTGKLIEIDYPHVPVDAGGGSTTNIAPKVKYVPWQTFSVPTGSTSPTHLATPTVLGAIYGVVTDPIGRISRFYVNRYGQPVVTYDPLLRGTTINYAGILPTRVVHPNHGEDTVIYLSGTPLPSYIKMAGDSGVFYHYGAKNQIDSIWGPAVNFERRFLNATNGRTDSIQYTHSAAQMVRFTYDSLNRLLSATDPGTHTAVYHYDATFGNLDSVSRPGNIYTVGQFDAFGRDTALRSAGSLVKQRLVYDTLNRVRKVWHPGIANDTTIITYDSLFPVRVRGPGGEIYKFATNALGWTTQRYDSKDTSLYIGYRYDTAGHLTSYTNRRGQTVTMTYDALDRMLSRTVNATLTDYFDYDTNDRWTSAWRNNVSRDTTFYNINGEIDSLVRKIAGHRYAITYEYSVTGGTTALQRYYATDAGFSFVRIDDIVHDNMPATDSSITGLGPIGNAFSRQARDVDGRPTLLTMSTTAVQNAVHFNALHQQYWSVLTQGTRSAVRDSLSRAFTLDSLGRVTFDALWDNAQGQVPDRSFVYDSLGQLLKVRARIDSACVVPSDTLALGFQYSCGKTIATVTQDSASYDAAGNRLFPAATYSTMGNRLLTGPSGTSYTYDADGNIVTRTHGGVTDSLYWSAVGLLDSVASGGSSGLRHRYEYNSYGQLVRRQTAHGLGAYSVDRYFFWDENHLVAELDSPGTSYRVLYQYSGDDDQPINMITPSIYHPIIYQIERTYYQDPVEGNLTGIMANTTSLQQYTQYSAWGQILQRNINTLADTNRLGWKGLMYEGDSTRLYYARNRWYDPATGRFVSEDPLGIAGGLNLYTFAGNDPINGEDPSGLFSGWDLTGGFFNPYGLKGKIANFIINAIRTDARARKRARGAGLSSVSAANQGNAGKFSTGFRGPDFVNLNVNVALINPITLSIIGWSGSASLDRYGDVYWSPTGVGVGKSLGVVSGSLTANWVNQSQTPSREQLNGFLSGNGFNAAAGWIVGGAESWTPGSGTATGFGIVSPQAGVSYNYSWRVTHTGFGW